MPFFTVFRLQPAPAAGPTPVRLGRVVAILLALCLSPLTSAALVLEVDATKDLPDLVPGDGVCLTEADTCSVRAAFEEANAFAGPDSIVIPRGRYRLTLGSIEITEDLDVTGFSAKRTALQGDRHHRLLAIPFGVTVSISQLTLRSGGDADGAGIHNNGDLGLTAVILTRHSADAFSGGALYNSGTATLEDVYFLGNSALYGAAIYNVGTVEMTDTYLRRNRHTVGGGGAGLFNAGLANVERSTFIKNQARIGLGGGAIYNNGSLDITNSTISRNRARISTGGGLVTDTSGVSILTNVTLVRNQARFVSGGIANFGFTSVHNCIVAENFNNRVRDINCGGDNPVLSSGFNIDSGAVCSFTGPGDRSNQKPYTRGEKLNGGLTPSRELMSRSPAIDAGDPDFCPPTDQRGMPRPVDGNGDLIDRCDIGSFELQAGE